MRVNGILFKEKKNGFRRVTKRKGKMKLSPHATKGELSTVDETPPYGHMWITCTIDRNQVWQRLQVANCIA